MSRPTSSTLSVTDKNRNIAPTKFAIGICGLFGRDARDGISVGKGAFSRLWLQPGCEAAQWLKGPRV
ncbi:hypothetical protein CGRA01v4_10613 [Colletotrichum graminicola]|nr:hypothetical protein CGRA01v4_10613 [Colletotrichum graminicola]